jgi:glycosyltransferase involved in cell wall biosynthesis
VKARLHEDKILTVPLGAPPPLPKDSLPSEPQPTLRVIYVGTVSVRKGAHYLLRAWERVAGPGMELHLYGAILLPDSVCKAALAGRNGGRIVFHGSIPARQLGDVYEQSSVLVLPTLCDGFGQVVTDALAHGLPVITTSNAGAADIVEHGKSGLIIPAADEDALAAALEWCADHRPPLFDMREAALAAAGSWTWAHFRRRFGALAMAAVHGQDQRPAHSTVAIGVTT